MYWFEELIFFWLFKQVWLTQFGIRHPAFFPLLYLGHNVADPYLSLWDGRTFSSRDLFLPQPCMMQFVLARGKAYTLAWNANMPINISPRECGEPLESAQRFSWGPWSAHSSSSWKRASKEYLQPWRNGLIKMHKGVCTEWWLGWKKAVFTYCYTKNIHTSSNCQSCLQATIGVFPSVSQ